MQTSTAYYVVLLYLTVMFKPFAPILMDRFAHAFAEAEHISKVHAVYGANHLENKLADLASENESSKSRHTLTGSCEVPFHIITQIATNVFLPTEHFIAYHLFSPLPFAAIAIPPDERPPQVC